ncbi:TolC family outer membrane protein [Frigidibacter sp. MR17.14]|uniref:TolC family outer membrane protein n=1 Tax=Frigidibacter sp. MR17.14 TaxID=3126509 RepID=UPI003012D6A2
MSEGRTLRRYGRFGASAMALVLGLAFAAQAQAETLADALASAYRNSHLLEQNRAVLRAADEDAAQAVATLRPVVAFIAQTDYSKTLLTEGSTSQIGLTASLVLWDNGRNRLGIEIARESVLATRQALVQVEQQVLLSAVSAYFQVRSALESVSINQNSIRVLDEELRATSDRFEVGEVTRTDVSLAEAQRAAARASLAAAQGDLEVAREAYKAATGHYPGSLAPAPAAPALPRTLGEAKSIAQRNHPSILEAQRQVKVSDLQVKLAGANFGPSVDITAQTTLDEYSDKNSAVSLGLSQTLYAGGAVSSAHRRAVAGRDQSRAALLQTGVTVEQSVGESWSSIDVSRAQIRATAEQIQAAQVAYDGIRDEAALGSRTTLDVLDAEQDLLDARADRITAQANEQIALYSLLSSMGLLTVQHLGLNVPVYDPDAYYQAVKNAPLTSSRGKSLDKALKAMGKQ